MLTFYLLQFEMYECIFPCRASKERNCWQAQYFEFVYTCAHILDSYSETKIMVVMDISDKMWQRSDSTWFSTYALPDCM